MRVIGLGAGGHAKVVIETLGLMGDHEIIGLLDPKRSLLNTLVLGIEVIGDDNRMAEVYASGVRHAFVGVGGVGDLGPRQALFEQAKRQGFDFVAAVHPLSVISPSAEIGEGPNILALAVVNAKAKIGDNVIINTGAIVEHDCILGDHVHIATGASLASSVTVGNGSHIGAGATIREGITIGKGSVVGAGAVVVKDVSSGTVVVGVPAEPMSESRFNR